MSVTAEPAARWESPDVAPAFTDTEKAIINRLQYGLPLTPSPYRDVAEELGISEQTLLDTLQALLANRTLTRFGPMFHAGEMGGGLTLAAMRIPEQDFDRVTEQVNSFAEVAHNYRREHELNMWFVLATETPEGIAETIGRIEALTGYPVYNMPKEQEFHVNLHFEV
ncbi:Lrp/AsnC family transcriptional regulator [Marinobacter sp. UBA3607]|jgi:DNA-binding Lrp family transcriptional regulator|uniref:Lrp/AsnC family transcriptional regulator n=1 Tax=Marinobacter sp. UBA3607 TaxID=1946820 RepID=UPI000E93B469|nr:Lrp/AsnC family transcriptional regulator [Marinobacter sp. UBA3607]HBM50458.1 AsnC family protein [Marinobacter sp.]|tara:strand:+ start:6512 stop:7012 length:501 start_codon:yes stop_codon:yes gene_type:complete